MVRNDLLIELHVLCLSIICNVCGIVIHFRLLYENYKVWLNFRCGIPTRTKSKMSMSFSPSPQNSLYENYKVWSNFCLWHSNQNKIKMCIPPPLLFLSPTQKKIVIKEKITAKPLLSFIKQKVCIINLLYIVHPTSDMSLIY